MLKIRLQRKGKMNDPFYRVILTQESKKGSGQATEVLGTWNPVKKIIKIDKKRVGELTKLGAQPSASVKELLKQK